MQHKAAITKPVHLGTCNNVPDTVLVSAKTSAIRLFYFAPLAQHIFSACSGGLIFRTTIADSALDLQQDLPDACAAELSSSMQHVYTLILKHDSSPLLASRGNRTTPTPTGFSLTVESICAAAQLIAELDQAMSHVWDLIFNKYYSDIKHTGDLSNILAHMRVAKRKRWYNSNISQVLIRMPSAALTGNAVMSDMHADAPLLVLCKPYKARDILAAIGENPHVEKRTTDLENMLVHASSSFGRLSAIPVTNEESLTVARLMDLIHVHFDVVSKNNFLKRYNACRA